MSKILAALKEILPHYPEYYDYTKLDDAKINEYKTEADSILSSTVFNNEMQHLISDIMYRTLLESADFDEVRMSRAVVLALEEFKNRLERLQDAPLRKPAEDPQELL